MTTLSEKYLAGFLDADGTFGIKFIKKNTGHFPVFYLDLCQEAKKDKVIHLLKESFGGTVHEVGDKSRMSRLSLPSKQARMLLFRIKKYLVIKRQYADYILDYFQSLKGPYTDMETREHEKHIKLMRKEKVALLQNHPTRKWLAGYVDGDGCVAYSYRKVSGLVYISMRITAEPAYRAGLDLLKKAFGGNIYGEKHIEGTYPVWVLPLPPSKAKQFFGYFAKHSIVKRDQMYFILGCAEGGNFRDGKAISNTIKQLKAQEQRLNDQSADVAELVRAVDFDVKLTRNRPVEYAPHMRQSNPVYAG